LDSDRFRRVEEVFTEASRLDGDARERFVTQACGDDDELLREVHALLSHDTQPVDFFRTPALDAGVTLREKVRRVSAESGETPARIGAYRLIRVIGEGGFGVVYIAEQDMPSRTVALKILRPGLATRNILKRFEYEAQVLGRLHHPGIAHIYEAGSADIGGGRRQAYVAMEYIEGKPLTTFAREKDLGVRERLELIAKVCDAVQHAHQKGIIHRDLKPANILVVESEGSSGASGSGDTGARYTSLRAQPKILDFGVARATDPELASTTLQTGIGQLVGTLPYMSPEQVAGESGEVDTRSDVYGIGVLLFEVLAGRLPYELGSRSIPDAARVIREQPPTKLGSINRSLRGEIDIIVGEALEKDKKRRYQSAAALADDIRRFLRGEPIAAKRDSALYVLRKQLRRYWAATLVAATFLLLLIGFSIYVSLQSRSFRLLAERETAANRETKTALSAARTERARADQNATLLTQQLAAANIEQGRLLGRSGATISAEKLIWREHLVRPESTHTYWALWDLYSREPWLATFQAHDGQTSVARFVPNSTTIISAGQDGRIRHWDAWDGSCLATLAAHDGVVQWLDITRDGRRMVSTARDRRIIVWDLEQYAPLHVLVGHDADQSYVHIHPDGKLFLSCGMDCRDVRIWDLQTAELTQTLSTPTVVHTAIFAPDRRTVAASLRDSSVRVWPDALAQPGLYHDIRVPTGLAGRMVFSPDSRFLYAGGGDRELRVFDVLQCRAAARPISPNDQVANLSFTPDTQRLVTSGWWSINLWDTTTNTVIQSYPSPDGCSSFDYSPDGRFLAFGGVSGALRILELHPGGARVEFSGHDTRTSASLSPDGRILATGDVAGVIRLWDVNERRLIAQWKGHNNRVCTLRFDSAGARLATGGLDRFVRVWDLKTGNCIESIPSHHARTSRSLAWTPDGKFLVHMGFDQFLHVVDTETWTDRNKFYLGPTELLGMALGNQHPIVATILRNAQLCVWTLDGELLASFDVSSPSAWTADFSPDDSLLAAGNWAWTVEVFDWRAGGRVALLEGHTSTVWSVGFDPADPRVLATTASDGTIRLWDVADERCLLTLGDFANSEGLTVAFSQDGSRLVGANSTGRAIVWDTNYYRRHIAQQLEFQIRTRGAELGDLLRAQPLRDWAAAARQADTRTRSNPPSSGVAPETIATWGASLRLPRDE
jgi:WD40 repeat protein/serine/threonine protein kinase